MQFIVTLLVALIVFPLLMTWGILEVMKTAPLPATRKRRRR